MKRYSKDTGDSRMEDFEDEAEKEDVDGEEEDFFDDNSEGSDQDRESSLDENLASSYSLEEALKNIPTWLDRHMTLRKDLIALTSNEDLQTHSSQSLEEFRMLPSQSVAFVGATGSGKSTVINTLLEDDIVPTSSSKACTSVVTEISYNDENDYRADIHFVTGTEWKQELMNLKGDIEDDIQQQREKFKKLKYQRDVTKVSECVKKSWQKLVAVYSTLEKPFTFFDYMELVHKSNSVNSLLDTTKWPFLEDCIDGTKKIVCAEAKDLLSSLRRWIGDKGCWPLIKKVNIRVHSAVLSTGITLVDLPGFGDSNEARAAVAEEYRKTVDHYFVVIPVTRAVDSKSTKDLFNMLKQQFSMDGILKPSCSTFIVTKCDDVQVAEVATDYDLDNDGHFIKLKEENEQWQERFDIATADEERAYNAVKEYEDGIAAKPSVKTSNEAASARKHTIDSTRSSRPVKRLKYDGKCLPVPANHEDLTTKRDQKKLCDLELRKSHFALKTFCSHYRSRATKQSLIQSFETELEDCGAQETNFPVFTVSAQDYQVLKKKKRNEDTKTFIDVADTQIPGLQEHCRTLPHHSLKLFAERATGALARSTHSILQAMQNMERDETDRKRLEREWGRHATVQRTLKARLMEKYKEETAAMVGRFKIHFNSGMAVSCADAASKASSDILDTAQCIVETTSWQRFRAALRRKGVYENLNINYEFTSPFISTVVCAWRVTLDQDVFPETSETLWKATKDLLDQIPDACHSSSFKKTVTDRVSLMLEETTSRLEALHDKVTSQIDRNQRNISTAIVPHIKDQLAKGYVKALEFEGTGSVVRQKEYFINFVKTRGKTMFTNLHDFILGEMNFLADSIGDVVGEEMSSLAIKMYNEMSLLWQDTFDVESKEAVKLRESTDDFKKTLETWIDALKASDTEMECTD